MRNSEAIFFTKTAEGAKVTEKSQLLYVEEKSVKGSEFYTAYQTGFMTEYVLDVHPADFEFAGVNLGNRIALPSQVEYKGERYMIIRSYRKSPDNLEITIGKNV